MRLLTGAFAVLLLWYGTFLFGATREETAAYVDGTVTTIPQKAQGTLDLNDETSLQFRYGQSVYAVPYERIESWEFSRRADGFGSRITQGVSKLMFFKKKVEYLTIDFRKEDAAALQTIVLELPKEVATAAIPMLEARVRSETDNAAVETPSEPVNNDDSWWGNRVWHTTRNDHLWEKSKDQRQQTDK